MPAATASWVEAIRDLDWPAAASALDALPKATQAAPEARYARARVALELGEPARAAAELAGLEPDLPLLAHDIAALRARASLDAGQPAAAAAYYAARPDAASQLSLARALQGAGDLPRARQAADRAQKRLLGDRSDDDDQAEVRLLRARLAADAGDRAGAAAIYRWLAVRVPLSPHAADADQRLAELAPAQALTRPERWARALLFARAGRVVATDLELERLAAAVGAAVSEGEQVYARAFARYQARREPVETSASFTRAAELDPAHRSRNLYYAARALGRGEDDRRAISLFRELVRRFPKAAEADDARFQIGRLAFVLGDFPQAIAGYGEYLARHGIRGEFADSARYERAVAWLASGEHARAAKAFAELTAAQDDSLLAASYRELRGVALMGAGKRGEAEAEFRSVIAAEPLSLPALLATARLRALGVASPLAIAPAAVEPAPPVLAVTLPPKAALLHRLGFDGDAEAEVQSSEGALRAAFADRGNEAVCAAYGELSVAAQRYAAGRRAARWQTLRIAPSARTRWLWDCLYPRPYAALVASAEKSERLPAHLVHAIMRQESGFRPTVISPAQAVGLLQLIPPTAEAVSKELSLPYQPALLESPPYNVRLGARYLRRVLERFGEHPALAAAAYNAGPGAVSHWLESGESLPLDVFVARIPYHETRVYVHRVLGNLARYEYLDGGDAAVPVLDLTLPQGKRATKADF